MPDVCLACLDEEGRCFLCGEVRYLPLSQSHAWQEMEEPESPATEGKALFAKRIWGWLVEPGRNAEEALPDVSNLLWARDGERWEAWEKQHHPVSHGRCRHGNPLPGCRYGRAPAISSSIGKSPTASPGDARRWERSCSRGGGRSRPLGGESGAGWWSLGGMLKRPSLM
ncbi:hypothetical protein EOD39_21834 [Acipenser ruthenus]|uniref:Uncharacterized protein n=1 Tax=Acipenser ruthenus TaxID=7906 RepID=A0A444URK5_ACIRT|nr:hypothetical protein EOD39_21834 [Acipenser ruthenus]